MFFIAQLFVSDNNAILTHTVDEVKAEDKSNDDTIYIEGKQLT